MIKKILFIALFISYGYANAQNYSLDPGPVVEKEIAFDVYSELNLDIVNNTNDVLNITWEIIENSFNTGWDYSLCDYGTCHLMPFPSSSDMDGIPAGQAGFLKLSLNPYEIADTAELVFYIYETNNPTIGDTVILRAVSNVASSAEVIASSFNTFSIYPNPTTDFIYIDGNTTSSTNTVAAITDIEGRVIQKNVLSNNKISVKEIPSGLYYLNFVQSGKTIETKTIQIY